MLCSYCCALKEYCSYNIHSQRGRKQDKSEGAYQLDLANMLGSSIDCKTYLPSGSFPRKFLIFGALRTGAF